MIEIIEVKLLPIVNAANGKNAQQIVVTWKNTGSVPIRIVKANMAACGKGNALLFEVKDYTVFATFQDRPGIAPGEVCSVEPGFILPGYEGMPGYEPAEFATAELTYVSEGMDL
jgi:hypothetical protein